MIKTIRQIWQAKRRVWRLDKIRRKFAQFGYPLDQISDAQLEGALTYRNRKIEEFSLSAKPVYLVLRRLSENEHFFLLPENRSPQKQRSLNQIGQ